MKARHDPQPARGAEQKANAEAFRVFKTTAFARLARRHGVTETLLCRAIQELIDGQFSADLGGGVYKKRLNKNMHRSIILSKCGKRWIFEYLFAKNERDNISNEELRAYKLLAKIYARLTDAQLDAMIAEKSLIEVHHGIHKK